MILCLDGGTTNTRIRLMDGTEERDVISASAGSNHKNNKELREAVKKMIREILERNALTEKDIPVIMACGMVTSELGLFELPHILTPAGKEDFRNGVKKVLLEDVSGIPFCFIPGVKEAVRMPNIMRGEETECLGLIRQYHITEPLVLILPGSHNKVISFDGEKITAIYSMMSGEILAALSGHTILKNTLPEKLPKTFDREALLEGAEECRKYGLTGAALRERTIGLSKEKSDEWLTSFLAGTVLYSDIVAIREKAGGKKLLIGGGNPLREEVAALCRAYLENEITVADEETAVLAAALGAAGLWEDLKEKL